MFKLFNRNEKYLHDLDPLSAINKEILNAEDILDLKTTMEDEVEKKFRILTYIEKYASWKEFVVEGVLENRTEGTRDIYAENSVYELMGDYIEDSRANNTKANIALERALASSRWEVGRVDDLGDRSVSFYRTNALQAIHDIAATWNCEIQTRIVLAGNKIVHRYVDLLAERGSYLGERFVTGENISKISRETHDDRIITALYGYGKGEEVGEGHGRRIDFSDVNAGQTYVENNESRELWGRLNPDGTRAHIFGKVEFDEIEDPQELLEATIEELEKISIPKITYKGEVIGSVARLGDTVALVDKTYTPELRLTARVYEIENDLLTEGDSKPVLGNFISNTSDGDLEQLKFINGFRRKQAVWDRARLIGPDGNINAQYLSNLIDEMNARLNSQGGYVFLSEAGRGLITYDAPTEEEATMAIQILGGAFRIANSKLATGDWDWSTIGDGDGFVADAFIGGVLKGQNVHFDLTNGTLLVGESTERYSLFYDGNNLKLMGEIEFWDSGKKVAWINGQQLFIDSAVVKNDFLTGNHLFEKHSTGTAIKWAGE